MNNELIQHWAELCESEEQVFEKTEAKVSVSAMKEPELKEFLKSVKEDLKNGFVKWGYINGFSSETEDEFWKVYEAHEKEMKANPEEHEMHHTAMNMRGTDDNYKCSCGFEYSVDSSD